MFEWLNANAVLIELLMTILFIGTSVVVIRASHQANVIASETLDQMRRERLEDSRPVVTFELDVDPRRNAVHLMLHNQGRGAARDVKLALDQPLKTGEERVLADKAICQRIGFIAPGESFRDFATWANRFFQLNEGVTEVTGSLRYRSSGGAEYTERIHFNLQTYAQQVQRARRGADELVRVVKDVCEKLEKRV